MWSWSWSKRTVSTGDGPGGCTWGRWEGPGRLVLRESLGAPARVQSTLAWAAALSAPTPEVGMYSQWA